MLKGFKAAFARFNAAAMVTAQSPKKPLVVVLGSTGTGKSEVRLPQFVRGP